MITLSARAILGAIERGEIEAEIDDCGLITILIDSEQNLRIPENPRPQVFRKPGNVVNVNSGDAIVATVRAETLGDANEIATTFRHLLNMA